jgi:hypothetical protein
LSELRRDGAEAGSEDCLRQMTGWLVGAIGSAVMFFGESRQESGRPNIKDSALDSGFLGTTALMQPELSSLLTAVKTKSEASGVQKEFSADDTAALAGPPRELVDLALAGH